MQREEKTLPISPEEARYAYILFRKGMDTLDISKRYNVPESEVYNGMYRYKQKIKNAQRRTTKAPPHTAKAN